MGANEYSANEWRDLCIALIEKINSIAIGLSQWLRESKTDKEKLDHIKEYFVVKILSGNEENSIFSGIDFNDNKVSFKDIVEVLFKNLD